MKIIAVIKASSRSQCYPERYSARIDGVPLLDFMVGRIRQSKYINKIVLSTTAEKVDMSLVDSAKKLNVESYCGTYDDLIDRLYGAAKLAEGDIIVKVCGHYPLVDPWEADKLIEKFLNSEFLYAYNEHYRGLILGLGVEIFKWDLIDKAHREVQSNVYRRFGSNIFKNIVDRKNTLISDYPAIRPNYRVSLAVPEDLVIINQIVQEVNPLNYSGILNYLDKNPVIVKYAQQNISGPAEVGVEKIFLFPEKISSINNALKYNTVDESYPVSVELTLTDRCHLECEWCSDRKLRERNTTNQDIDFEVLRKLLEDLSKNGTKGIVIEGGGEPALYSSFEEVLDLAKGYGFRLGLITNGIILPSEKALKQLDWIRISLDATNKEQFLRAKKKDFFDEVMHNIEKIGRFKEKHDFIIGIAYVLTCFNEDNIEELILNLSKIGVDYVQLRPVVDCPELLPQKKSLEYLEKYSTPDFTIHIHNLKENVIRGNANLPCCAHSLSTVIAANGNVYICGRLNKYEWLKPIGNLYQASFYEIWNGQERRKQVNMVLDSDFCREWCPECRLTKFNILFNNTRRMKTTDFI